MLVTAMTGMRASLPERLLCPRHHAKRCSLVSFDPCNSPVRQSYCHSHQSERGECGAQRLDIMSHGNTSDLLS